MKEAYLNRMKEYLKEDEYLKLLKEYEKDPVRSIRLNNISYDDFIKKIDMDLTKIPYDIDGYYLNSNLKYGNHPYHHLGAFYFQEPSAMAPINLLEFKGDEKVLDLCASPGGKSSQILKRIPEGILVSNEINYKRSQVLFQNLERMSFSNAIITNNSAEELSKKLSNYFDVLVIDAPCSGEGMMRKDSDALEMWSLENVYECAKRDKEILKDADKMLKKDGYLIYSTCTFSKEENCDIVKYLIDELGYTLLEPSKILKDNLHEGFIKNTLRFYPFTLKGEGQFMALLQKRSESYDSYKLRKKEKDTNEIKIIRKFLSENLTKSDFEIIKEKNKFYIPASNLDLKGLNVLNYGILLGEVEKNRFIPHHHMFKTLGKYFKRKVYLDVFDTKVNHFLKGEEIDYEISNGFGVIIIDGLVLSGFKAVNNKLKNYYPKGLRNFNLN